MHALNDNCNNFYADSIFASVSAHIPAMNRELTKPPENYYHHTVSNIWLEVLADVSNASTVFELTGLKQRNLQVPLICLAVSNIFFSFDYVRLRDVQELNACNKHCSQLLASN